MNSLDYFYQKEKRRFPLSMKRARGYVEYETDRVMRMTERSELKRIGLRCLSALKGVKSRNNLVSVEEMAMRFYLMEFEGYSSFDALLVWKGTPKKDWNREPKLVLP